MSAHTVEPIFHLALARQWADAMNAGEYRISTLDAALDEVGYIHASLGDQVEGVANLIYAAVREPLVLLQIDPAGLDVRFEPSDARNPQSELFPHIYGPLPVACVTNATPAHMEAGQLVLEPADPF